MDEEPAVSKRFACALALAVLLSSQTVPAADWQMPGMGNMPVSPWIWGMPGMTSQSPTSAWQGAASGMAAQMPTWANSAGQAAQSLQGFIPWAQQGSGTPSPGPWSSDLMSSLEPNLTGTWRGSGGEHVEIRRNVARVWSSDQQYCDCIFMIHGNRLIAFSPDTDVVRKYEFASDRDRFALRDEQGQTMVFQRTR